MQDQKIEVALNAAPIIPSLLSKTTKDTFGGISLAISVADASQKDSPLVWVNDAFCAMTGYSRDDIIGRNSRFMHGPDTEQDKIDRIDAAMAESHEIDITIVNYRADGTTFNNHLLIVPVAADDHDHGYLVGFQHARKKYDENERVRELDNRLMELQHRVKNHLSMVVAMIRKQARHLEPKKAAFTLTTRVEALALLYKHVNDHAAGLSDSEEVLLGAYLTQVCGSMQALSESVSVRVTNAIEDVRTNAKAAANLGMITAELVTNALQHGFDPDDVGEVHIEVTRTGEGIVLKVSDDGRGLGDSGWPDGGGLGGSIVRNMVDHADGTIDIESSTSGTVITVLFPRA